MNFQKTYFFYLILIFLSISYSKNKILIIRPFIQDYNTFTDQVITFNNSSDSIIQRRAPMSISQKAIESHIKKIQPEILILMDNPSMESYRLYQQNSPDSTQFCPAILVMGALLEGATTSIQNSYIIPYEAPFTKSAELIHFVDKKIAVIHRPFLSTYIEEEKKQIENLGLELVSFPLSSDQIPSLREIKETMQRVINNDISTLWLVNDNAILTPITISTIFTPLQRSNKLSVIVNVHSLIKNHDMPGTIAVLPDETTMAQITANLCQTVSTAKVRTKPAEIIYCPNYKVLYRK